MQKLHAAFGDTAMNAVIPYMSPAVRAAYGGVTPLPYSQMAINSGVGFAIPVAGSAAYAYDLLLLQYLSTNDSPKVALHKANLYIQVHNLARAIVVLISLAADVITIYDKSTDIGDWLYFWSNKNPSLPAGPFGQTFTGLPEPVQPPIIIPDPGAPNFPPIDNPPPDGCFDGDCKD
jgi:hypothetical protein